MDAAPLASPYESTRVLPGSENPKDQAAAHGAGRLAAGQPNATVQRLRQTRLPLQGHPAAQAWSLLSIELHLEGQEPKPLRAAAGCSRGQTTATQLPAPAPTA